MAGGEKQRHRFKLSRMHWSSTVSVIVLDGSVTQNSLPLITEPYKGISYPVGDLCRRFKKLTGRLPILYIAIRYYKHMVQMASCDLLHAFHNKRLPVFLSMVLSSYCENFYISPY